MREIRESSSLPLRPVRGKRQQQAVQRSVTSASIKEHASLSRAQKQAARCANWRKAQSFDGKLYRLETTGKCPESLTPTLKHRSHVASSRILANRWNGIVAKRDKRGKRGIDYTGGATVSMSMQ